MKYFTTILSIFIYSIGLCQEKPLSSIVDTASSSMFTLSPSNKCFSEIVYSTSHIDITYMPPPFVKVRVDSFIYYGDKLVAIRYKSGVWKYYDRQKTIDVLFNNIVSLFP